MSDTTLPTVTPIPQIPPELPVLPLRETVVFPLTVQPLAANRPVSVDSINRALGGDRLLLLLPQVGDVEDPGPEALKTVGTVAVIRQMSKIGGAVHLIVEGLVRAKAVRVTREGTTLQAVVEPWPDDQTVTVEV